MRRSGCVTPSPGSPPCPRRLSRPSGSRPRPRCPWQPLKRALPRLKTTMPQRHPRARRDAQPPSLTPPRSPPRSASSLLSRPRRCRPAHKHNRKPLRQLRLCTHPPSPRSLLRCPRRSPHSLRPPPLSQQRHRVRPSAPPRWPIRRRSPRSFAANSRRPPRRVARGARRPSPIQRADRASSSARRRARQLPPPARRWLRAWPGRRKRRPLPLLLPHHLHKRRLWDAGPRWLTCNLLSRREASWFRSMRATKRRAPLPR